MKNFYLKSFLLFSFLLIQICVFGQVEHGQKNPDLSTASELSFYKNSDDIITSKKVDYFVELKNGSRDSQIYELSGEIISCDGSALKKDVVKFEILNFEGDSINSVEVLADQTIKFLVRTIKSDMTKSSWNCIEIRAKAESSSKDNVSSIVIKQLNPGASTSK